jgi:hypothetical protein
MRAVGADDLAGEFLAAAPVPSPREKLVVIGMAVHLATCK